MASNVFLTTLSTLPSSLNLSTAKWEDGTTFQYFMQQRPGYVFTRDKRLGEGKRFSRIIAICTDKVRSRQGVDESKQVTLFGKVLNQGGVSVFDAFKYQLEHDTQYAEDKSVTEGSCKCPEGIIECFKDGDGIGQLIATLSKQPEDASEDKTINLYIDTQGGSRTTNLLVQAVLSIADRGSANIRIKSIVAGEGNPKDGFTYKDVKGDYGILTLVSGMNAFLQYGKADLIQNYIKRMSHSGEARQLADKMVEVDHAISVCDAKGMLDAIQSLDAYLNTNPTFESPFDYLATEIKAEYDSVMCGNEVDIPKLIKWMKEKQFYQQALTLCEASMPGWMFSSHGKLRYEYDYVMDGCQSDREYWDNWCILDANGNRRDEYKKNDRGHFMFERVFFCRLNQSGRYRGRPMKDNWQGNTVRFSLFVNGDEILRQGTSWPDACRCVSGNTKLESLLSRYSLIKDVRNAVNHASESLDAELRNIYPNQTFNDSTSVIRSCVSDFLNAYNML